MGRLAALKRNWKITLPSQHKRDSCAISSWDGQPLLEFLDDKTPIVAEGFETQRPIGKQKGAGRKCFEVPGQETYTFKVKLVQGP